MGRKLVTRVEGRDEAAAFQAIRLAERGPVSFSDDHVFAKYIDDPDEAASYVEHALRRGLTFVVERVQTLVKVPIEGAARVEGRSKEAALRAMHLAEGGPVSYSDGTISARRVTDPDVIATYLIHALRLGSAFVVERKV